MINSALLKKLDDSYARIEKIAFLQSAEQEDIQEIIEEYSNEDLNKHLALGLGDEEDAEVSYILENRLLGYLFARVSTPVIEKVSKSGGFRCSWGYTRFTLIYASDMEELVAKGSSWAETTHKEMIAKAKEKMEVADDN
jgi:hypothetical protein